MFFISKLISRSIFDSRGNPTVEVDVVLNNNALGRSSAPSGASTGSKEAVELRNQEDAYCGKSVFKIVNKINNDLAKKISKKQFRSQEELDNFLITLDGTDNKSNLGTNLTTPVSIAFAKAIAKHNKIPLFSSIDKAYTNSIPKPILNIINGGKHANNMLDIQEFMIIPQKHNSIQKNLRIACEIFHKLQHMMEKKGYSTNIGDEGGFAPELKDNKQALDLIFESSQKAGYTPGKDVSFALDVAATEMYNKEKYEFKGESKTYDKSQLLQYYQHLYDNYPIIYIEDPFAEDDLEGWKIINNALGDKIKIVGDDLFVTNTKYLQKSIDNNLANSILIKVNQVGTLTETLNTIKLAKDHNYKIIISHRSGETEDTAIAHLAVATAANYIKAGSICRTDRTAKYNELIRIEEALATN